MNWYKQSQLQTTLPYFEELAEYGDYIPDETSLTKFLQEKFGISIITDIGQGDSGVAYLLSNDDVLKITTNKQEGQIAQFLQHYKHPSIVDIRYVWQEGDLYYIIEEKLDPLEQIYKKYFNFIEKILDKKHCYNPKCAFSILQNLDINNNTLKQKILSYLKFLNQFPTNIFDFLNPNNIGMSNGDIKFFDIT